MGELDQDITLLNAVSQGSEGALVELMNRHKQPIFHFVLRYLGNEADAAETTEKTFFRVYQKAHTFTPRSKVKTWIFSIALNQCRDLLRKQKKFRNHHSLDADLTESHGQTSLSDFIDDGSTNPAQQHVANDEIAEIESAIQDLPEKLRFPFVFCVLQDHSHDNCAKVLGSNRKIVEMRIYRARKKLRNLLDEKSHRGS